MHLEPIPNFRHVLQWMLSSEQYSINWSFLFGKQMSWRAAEANWRLITHPKAALEWETVKAAVFDTGLKPTEKHDANLLHELDDGYDTDEYEDLVLKSHEIQEQQQDERLERMMDVQEQEESRARPRTREVLQTLGQFFTSLQYPDSEPEVEAETEDETARCETAEYDVMHEAHEGDEGDDAGDESEDEESSPHDFRLPPYAEAVARQMAARTPTPSLDSEEEERAELEEIIANRKKRSRYIDDEAVESETEDA